MTKQKTGSVKQPKKTKEKEKFTADEWKTAKHEIRHALMASLLNCDVFQIVLTPSSEATSKFDQKGACYHAVPKSNLDMIFIAIAPYCHEKSFTFKNLLKYGKENSDITNYMSYFTLLTEEEFNAHKTLVNAYLKDYKEVITKASKLLVENKIIHWQEWKDIVDTAISCGE